MLDLHFILENIDEVRQNTADRNVQVNLDQLVSLDEQRRSLIVESEGIRQRQNQIAKSMKSKMSQEERQALIEEGRSLKSKVAELETTLDSVKEQLHDLQVQIPNLTHPDVPHGDGDDDHLALRHWGTPREFDFDAKDHVDLGNELGLIDWESGAKVTGSKFYYLKNDAVWLELALFQYALSILREEGFTLATTPDLARQEILEGIGFNPRGSATQIYSVENTDLSLIATAEITLGGMHFDEILEESELPILLAGVSHCFRTEAGSPGRVSRGLYRVHQFSKVEMFAFTTPEASNQMLERFNGIQERIFQGLELPYRVVDCCRGDLGAQAYRKYDIEAWMPGRSEGGSYGEVTSASNCTDYQARRMKIRFRREGVRKPLFLHTLNGTAVATSRAMLAIMENFQQKDGTIIIPEALRPFMLGIEKIEPSK
jgi:seryl-tRNA synthetase